MEKARITFFRCIQDSQDYGSDDEHMVSRIFFKLLTPKGDVLESHADIKQTIGSDFETGPIEVSSPDLKDIKIDYGSFRSAAEEYYRSLVGSKGIVIRITGGKDIRMRNNEINHSETYEVDILEHPKAW